MIREFLLPTLNVKFFVRILVIIIVSYIIFSYLLIPLKIRGLSMEPTYNDRSFAFCWALQYLFSQPQRFDVVTVRFSGRKVMLLKRVIALPGETVEFRKGNLYINGTMVDEPYVIYRSDWDIPARKIAPGHVYVIGDNRSTSPERHRFGEVEINRIVGTVIP